MNQILAIFHDVHMSLNHDGLSSIAKTKNIDVNRLSPGQFVIFINKNKNRFKVYAPNSVLAYYRDPENRVITTQALQYIPLAFGAGGFEFKKSLEKTLTQLLKRAA
ncbi:MAG TPA: hypothetical protein PKW79_00345 [Rhabdochlamydiaceae bacterium]|nr:hypothetical protein [Rhabdochlamydiaceae bacterium]